MVATAAPPTPTLTPAPTTGVALPRLKYALIDRFGRLWYCDPDFYPVARAEESALAEQRFLEIQGDGETFRAIVEHLGYAPSAAYTADQKLAIYRDWKMLRALLLDPAGGVYHFVARFTLDERTGALVDGTIDQIGRITVTSQSVSGRPICPICLARGTGISTPTGVVTVEDLREGMAVWTMGAGGERVAAVVVAVGSMTAPPEHEVVRLVLADGRQLMASPGHPLPDRRRVGDLMPGDIVDGAKVLVSELVPYAGGTTFDLLPSGPTGVYWAEGTPLTSTIES